MSEMELDRHPEAELLAAFVDGALMGSELKSVAAHLRTCGECREAVGETARFQRDRGDAVVVPIRTHTNRWWIAAAAAVVVTAIGIPIAQHISNSLSPLQTDRRATPARVSAFDYAPYRTNRSGDVETSWKALSITAKLHAEAKSDHTSASLHRYGVAQLAMGKTQDALVTLKEASALEPQNAIIMSDLAAAQLTAGRIPDAAETAATALEREPSLPAAAFNLALALETMSNRPAAIKAWKNYLALESTSGWASEARSHLQELQKPRSSWEHDRDLLHAGIDPITLRKIVTAYPQRVRVWVLDDLLPSYIEQRHPEDLALFDEIAAIRSQNGDPFLRDVAADAHKNASDFAGGVLAFREARQATHNRQLEEAETLLNRATSLLEKAHSPLALTAAIYAASNASYRGNTDEAREHVGSMAAELEQYKTLAAEAKWVVALIESRNDAHGKALRDFRDALRLVRQTGETEHEVALDALIATELDELADREEADRYRIEALRRADEIGQAPQRLYVAYMESGMSQIRYGRPRLALTFIDGQEAIAHETGDFLLLAESSMSRAIALDKLDQKQQAASDRMRARLDASKIPTRALRDRTIAEIDYHEALADKMSNPQHALAALSSAMFRWQAYGWTYHTASACLMLGDIRRTTGDTRGAERDYRTGIAEMEKARRSVNVNEPELRAAHFERAEWLFEKLIDILVDEKRYDDAFTIGEQKRARVLLDSTHADSTPIPLDAASVRASIGAGDAIVEYSLLDRGVVACISSSRGTYCSHSLASRADLSSAIERYREAIEHDDQDTTLKEGRWLFQQLVRPVLEHAPTGAALIIVPDGVLFSLPFAALVAADRRYLIETHSITVTPSATIYLRTVSTPSVPLSGSSVLLSGQPAPADLPVLTQVRGDIEQLKAIYDGCHAYVGDELGPHEFLVRAADSGLIAFAGHAANDALLFESPNHQPAGKLFAREIAASRFLSHPTVVLAACGTGRGQVRLTEGADSLATAFLTAGARNVVATLWDADDETSSHLFLAFHRNLRRSQRAAEALRDAQLSMIHDITARNRQPSAWAGAVLVGTI